jgi:hypothetical protein
LAKLQILTTCGYGGPFSFILQFGGHFDDLLFNFYKQNPYTLTTCDYRVPFGVVQFGGHLGEPPFNYGQANFFFQ